MNWPYEEILAGEVWLRLPPGARHEMICSRLQARLAASLAAVPQFRLLPPRTLIQIRTGTLLRPDLAVVEAQTGKLWLAVEVINAGDHHPDTVVKKEVYEEMNVPRLWVVDPRYDNVEVYHRVVHGLTLKAILAGQEVLSESELPLFALTMTELFRKSS
jgi:Uma2 family endonuclease